VDFALIICHVADQISFAAGVGVVLHFLLAEIGSRHFGNYLQLVRRPPQPTPSVCKQTNQACQQKKAALTIRPPRF